MATACLREDRWLVHHLSCDLPVAEVIKLAADTGADLVVLSAAMSSSTQAARQAAEEIAHALPDMRVVAGRPGNTLSQLRKLARQAVAERAGISGG